MVIFLRVYFFFTYLLKLHTDSRITETICDKNQSHYHLQKYMAPGQKQPIRDSVSVLALPVMLVYVLPKFKIVELQLN